LWKEDNETCQEGFRALLSCYEWIRDSFVQPTPSSFAEQEKQNYIDPTYDNSLKRNFNSGNHTIFLNFIE